MRGGGAGEQSTMEWGDAAVRAQASEEASSVVLRLAAYQRAPTPASEPRKA